MADDVEVTQEDHAVLRAYFTARARLAFDGTTGPHADLLLQTLARHRIASVRAAAMSDAPSDDMVERIMSALWPVLGGNHTDADVWQQINDAVRAAIEQGQHRSEG